VRPGVRTRIRLTARRSWEEDADELLGLTEKTKENPFDILRLSRDSEQALVRPAFRKLAAVLHPDVPGTGDAASFRKLLWAYRELSSPDWRRWARQRAPDASEVRLPGIDLEDLFQDAVDAGPELDDWEEMYRRRQAEKEKKEKKEQQTQTNLVKRILEGSYEEKGRNHGRPVFRKSLGQGESVAIYYWDEKDGADCDGWWIGAEVGGDMVFAFNINQASMLPPRSGWRFPLRGPVDHSLRIVPGPDGTVQIQFGDISS